MTKQVAIFGIPIDAVTMDETVDAICSFRDAYATDQVSRLIATVNVDFVVNSLSFRPGKARHPELLDILCRADLVTADGMPLVWLSKLLGSPLPERVTGADLVPRLAAESAKRKLRLFFLGGRKGIAKQAAETLQTRYPDMQLAGISSPFIHTEGEALHSSEKDDVQLVAEINATKPDVLLVAFGNPKQEIWFNRNRFRLRVPVVVGIGGTFEFVAGTVKRAPEWMQRSGTEWIWRILQDPMRLWKRYAKGACKLFYLSAINLVWHWATRLIPNSAKLLTQNNTVTINGKITNDAANQTIRSLDACLKKNNPVLLDINNVSHFHADALGTITRTLHKWRDDGKYVQSSKISWFKRQYLMGIRAWTTFAELLLADLPSSSSKEAQAAHSSIRRFMYEVDRKSDVNIITLHGRLDATHKGTIDNTSLHDTIYGYPSIVDVSSLSFADSSGISFFLGMHKTMIKSGYKLHIAGARGAVQQMLQITKLDKVFVTHKTVESAFNHIKRES